MAAADASWWGDNSRMYGVISGGTKAVGYKLTLDFFRGMDGGRDAETAVFPKHNAFHLVGPDDEENTSPEGLDEDEVLDEPATEAASPRVRRAGPTLSRDRRTCSRRASCSTCWTHATAGPGRSRPESTCG